MICRKFCNFSLFETFRATKQKELHHLELNVTHVWIINSNGIRNIFFKVFEGKLSNTKRSS
jgi:hypothetical protein